MRPASHSDIPREIFSGDRFFAECTGSQGTGWLISGRNWPKNCRKYNQSDSDIHDFTVRKVILILSIVSSNKYECAAELEIYHMKLIRDMLKIIFKNLYF